MKRFCLTLNIKPIVGSVELDHYNQAAQIPEYMGHPIEHSILNDEKFKTSALSALLSIRCSFEKKIAALRNAYDEKQITTTQLDQARKKLLQEAALILYTDPADDCKRILDKLTAFAKHLDGEKKSFSIENYIK